MAVDILFFPCTKSVDSESRNTFNSDNKMLKKAKGLLSNSTAAAVFYLQEEKDVTPV